MIEQTPTEVDPLLRRLDRAQEALLQVVGEAVMATGVWPVYQYVQAKLDALELDSDVVLNGLPYFSGANLTYSLVRRDRIGREDEPVKLTIAGMDHLASFSSTVDMFLQVINALIARRVAAPFDPRRVVTVEVDGPELIAELGLENEPLVHLLPELLDGEPATWHGSQKGNEPGWTYRPSSQLRRFRGLRDVNDYVVRMRTWLMPPEPLPIPKPISPLSIAAAFDYLDVVWQLKFRRKLVHVPSAECAARLTLDVTTPAEFDSRLSALGEMFKGLDAPGDRGKGTFSRLRSFLTDVLPSEASSRALSAVDTLQKVTHLRNAGQHAGAARQAATALPDLGLYYPVVNHQAAWRAVQVHVVNALDAIRTEIHSATVGKPRPGPTREPSRGRSQRRPSARTNRGS